MASWKCSDCKQTNKEAQFSCSNCDSMGFLMLDNADEMEVERSMSKKRRRVDDATVSQGAGQVSILDQESDECIWIKDSCNITVKSHDTQAAVSLQVGLQLAIALVLSISLGDSDQGRAIAQEMFQKFDDTQTNVQKIYIENSKDCEIVTTDTDLSVNIQALLEVLVTLVARLDIF